jgi:hypothetical protein
VRRVPVWGLQYRTGLRFRAGCRFEGPYLLTRPPRDGTGRGEGPRVVQAVFGPCLAQGGLTPGEGRISGGLIDAEPSSSVL